MNYLKDKQADNAQRLFFNSKEIDNRLKVSNLKNLSLHFDETQDELMKDIQIKISNLEDLYDACDISESFDTFLNSMLDKISEAFSAHKKVINKLIQQQQSPPNK